MNSQVLPSRMIIQGVTRYGEKFRPSDWAERLQDCIATHKDCSTTHGGKDLKRLHNCMLTCNRQRKVFFSPDIHITFKDETKSLVIERKFWETKPDDYQFLMNFAKANELQMIEA
jgi:hypothetical protein